MPAIAAYQSTNSLADTPGSSYKDLRNLTTPIANPNGLNTAFNDFNV
ncbi:MAG: hypothetical protein GAK37_03379 [Pseudomonas sp.]|nr:MAG: hypothetical protein GAK37_03379 [Pseudomonas sp.]